MTLNISMWSHDQTFTIAWSRVDIPDNVVHIQIIYFSYEVVEHSTIQEDSSIQGVTKHHINL